MLHLHYFSQKDEFLSHTKLQPTSLQASVLAKVPGWRKPAGLLTLGKRDSETGHRYDHHVQCVHAVLLLLLLLVLLLLLLLPQHEAPIPFTRGCWFSVSHPQLAVLPR